MKTIHKELFKSTALIKLVLFLFLGLSTSVQLKSQSSYTITNIGLTFNPDTLYCNVGDNILFSLGSTHNVQEVSAATWLIGGTTSNGGFSLPFGGGTFTLPTAGTYYYVCTPHANVGMKGVIIACNLSLDPYTVTDATDAYANDGAITVNVTASGPFDYYLSDINGTPLDSSLNNPSSTHTFSNLFSGNYIVDVRNLNCDPNSPLSTDTVAIYPITGGTISFPDFMGYCFPTATETDSITAIFNGCSTVTSLGNEFELTDISGIVVWTITSMNYSVSLPPLNANQSPYTLQITNLDNNCTSTETFSIPSDTLESTFTTTQATSTSNGSFTVTVSGGSPPYTMSYNGIGPFPWINGQSISNLSAGTYIYTVTSITTGCTSQDTVVIDVNNCFAALDTIGSCNSIQLTATAFSTFPGTYNHNYYLYLDGILIDSILNTTSSNVTFPNYLIDSGQYVLDVTNITTGCSSTSNMLIDPNPMSIQLLTPNPSVSAPGACDGFIAIEVLPLAGNFPFTITWDTSGSNFYTQPGPWNNSNIDSLCENTYCVTVENANGCTDSACYDVIFSSCNTSLVDSSYFECYGDETGKIIATIDTTGGGVGDSTFIFRYTYTLFSLNPTTQVGFPVSINATVWEFTNLPAGSYRVDVVDNSYGLPFSCLSDSIELIQPDQIIAWTTVDSTDSPSTQNGKITIDSTTGGTPPYIYQWLDSVGLPLPTSSSIVNGLIVQDSLGYSNQYNGGYTILITDTAGCESETIVYVHPRDADANLSADTFYATDVDCHDSIDGKLYMRPFDVGPSSVPSFVYTWIDVDGVNIDPATGLPFAPGAIMRVDSFGSAQYNGAPSHVATYTNRAPGAYLLIATDYYGNPFPGSPFPFEIFAPAPLSVDLGPDIGDAIFDCGEDTVLTAITIGGNVTNDTTFLRTFELDFANPPGPTGIGDTLITGDLYLLEVSGTFRHDTSLVDHLDAAYDFTDTTEVMLWDFDFTNTHRPSPNTYNSSNNHRYYFPFIANGVTNPFIPAGMGIHTWSIPAPYDYNGVLSCTLMHIDTSVHIYNYNWTSDPVLAPAVISDEDTCYAYPGTDTVNYIVNVTDSKGCPATDTVKVWWNLNILDFNSIDLTHVVPCYGDSTGKINVSVDSSEGFPPYRYWVLDNVGTPINLPNLPVSDTTFNLPAGNYTVSLEDSEGCLSDASIVTITQPDSIYACGIDNLERLFLIDEFVMDFDTITGPFSHTSSIPTISTLEYRLVVEGTYGLDYFNFNHKDPAFIIPNPPLVPATGLPHYDWTMNDSTIRPDIDLYYDSSYSYTFNGFGAPTSFGFTDSNGTYYGNTGSLTFKLYKIYCAQTDTVYTCSGDSTAYSSIYAYGGVPLNPDGIDSSGDEYYNFIWTDSSGVDWTNNSITSGNSSYIEDLPAGYYTVTVIDSNGCSEYERYLRVEEAPTPLQIDSASKVNVLCHGDATGTITVYFSGGYGATDTIYKYLTIAIYDSLNNGVIIDTIYQSINDVDSIFVDSLIAGYYTLSVWDARPDTLQGPYFCEQTIDIEITEPPVPLSSTVNLLQDVSCWGDSTGAAEVIAWGGNSLYPYAYLWDNGETTDQADSLWADVNSAWPSPQWQGVTITDSNGCTHRDSIQIKHIHEEIQAFNTLDFILGVPQTNTVQVIQDVQCFNACDAEVTISSIGGSSNFHKYIWDIGHVGLIQPDTVTGLCAGGHNIIIEDAIGCRKTVYYQISQPDELFANAQVVDYWSNNGVNSPTGHVQCFGFDNGVAHAIATGGTTPYVFVWDSLTGQQNDTAYNLTPGIHTVYVTDDKGCMASDTVTITEPEELTIAIIDDSTVYSYCTGTNSAYLYSAAEGGTEPYNYVWSDPLGQTTQWADDLMAGTYTVIVLDANGCSASDTRVIDSVTNSMGASTSVTDISCFGLFDGSTLVDSVWGAVPITNTGILSVDYDYSWTGPNNYTASQQQINFLYAGNYGVTITDSNNCSITIYTDVQEPDVLRYTLYDITGETCSGFCDGSISVDVQGGTSPYYYDISENGTFPIPALDQVQLINNSLISGLCWENTVGLTTDYDIYVTDSNNCVGTVVWGGVWQATIDSGVVVSVSAPHVTDSTSCYNTNDGHANVWLWDQNSSFIYTWETLDGVVVDTGAYTTILSRGDYYLIAHYTDSSNFGQVYLGCSDTVQFNMPSPERISSDSTISPISCFNYTTANLLADGSISLNPSGGSGSGYTYQWDTTISLPNGGISSTINSLQAGTYTVTITDGSGCTETIAFDMLEPTQLTNDFAVDPPNCNGYSDGSITSNQNGSGTSPYSYSWNTTPVQTTATATGLSTGTYNVIVEDARGCQDTFDITLTDPDVLISTINITSYYGNNIAGDSVHIKCNGESNGSAIVDLGGGTSPYTYSWSTGGSNQTETGMPAGTHTVTVTDAQNCEAIMNVTLVEPDALVVNGSSTGDSSPFPGGFDISCKGLNDGECYASPTGGVKFTGGYYIYDWEGPYNGQISNDTSITDLYAGTYSVIVRDANGCISDQTFILTEPTEDFIAETYLVNYAGAAVSPVTADFQDNTVSVDQYDYTFYWPIGDSIDVINVTNLTDFDELSFIEIGENEVYVKVQNMNSGCIDDTTFIIKVQGIPEIHNVFTPNGDGTNDYFDFGEFAMQDIDVSIYSRWGEMVTNWQDANYKWDGRGIDGQDLPEGVYYYVLIATGEDGHAYQKKGAITLLR